MSVSKRINPYSKINEDTGFSNTGIINGGRFINRNGTFNLPKKGRPFWDRFSVFYTMLTIPVWQFITVIFIFYVVINLMYTGVYFWIGAQQFTGFVLHSGWGDFRIRFPRMHLYRRRGDLLIGRFAPWRLEQSHSDSGSWPRRAVY